ncbi:MAG: glycosyltransferase family 2 protein [Endomicrobiales bacterium]|nr:glycosyltransferase family 2 protein [Endomicrobiales bacterium]
MENNKITVVIVAKNSGVVLFECLQALNENDDATKPENSQWVIVDNASTDGSIERACEKFPFINVIKNTENMGFAFAANQGVRFAKNKLILFLNTDAQIMQGSISVLRQALFASQKNAVAGPRLVRSNGTIQKSVYPEPTVLTELLKPFVKLYVSFKEMFYRPGKIYRVSSLRGACFLARKDALFTAGLLDERFFFYLEETDLFRQLKAKGFFITYVPSSRVVHLGGKGSTTSNFDKAKMFKISLLKYFQKNRSWFENVIIKFYLRLGDKSK